VNFKKGDKVQVSGSNTTSFGGNALTAMLVNDSIAIVPPENDYLPLILKAI
jgi:hypothetical protein